MKRKIDSRHIIPGYDFKFIDNRSFRHGAFEEMQYYLHKEKKIHENICDDKRCVSWNQIKEIPQFQ